MRMKDPEMHKRMCEEVYKLGDSNRAAAEKLKCDPTLIGEWLRNGYMPNTYYLKNFYEAGADVIYILTGERHARS